MAQYDKPRGALFINLRKEKDNHPDHRGNLEFDRELIKEMVNQVNNGAQFGKVEIVGWNRSSDRAGNYISVSASKMREKPEEGARPVIDTPPEPAPQTSDDKIPF